MLQSLVPPLPTCVVQALYDSTVRMIAMCACLETMSRERRPRLSACLLRTQRSVSIVILGAAFFVASLAIIPVVTKDIEAGTTTNSVFAARLWAISRAISWVGTSMLVLLVMTFCKRRSERKNNFGKLRERYGWANAEELPSRPPDACVLCGWCLPVAVHEPTRTSTQEEQEHAREGPYRGPQGLVQKKKKKKKKTGGTDSEPADGAVRV